MNKRKMEKLKAAGWKVGNAEDFLELSKEERESMSKEIDPETWITIGLILASMGIGIGLGGLLFG